MCGLRLSHRLLLRLLPRRSPGALGGLEPRATDATLLTLRRAVWCLPFLPKSMLVHPRGELLRRMTDVSSGVSTAEVPFASVSRLEPRNWTAVLGLDPWPRQPREIAASQSFNEMDQSAQEPASSGEIAPVKGPRPSANPVAGEFAPHQGPRLSANPVAARLPSASATRTGAASSFAPAADIPPGLSGWLTGAGLPLAGGGPDEDEAGGDYELIVGPLAAMVRSWRLAGGSGAQARPALLPPGGTGVLVPSAPQVTIVKESEGETILKATFPVGTTTMPEYVQRKFMTTFAARLGGGVPAAAASTGTCGTRLKGLAGELDPPALARGGGGRQTANLGAFARAIRLYSQHVRELLEADALTEFGVEA